MKPAALPLSARSPRLLTATSTAWAGRQNTDASSLPNRNLFLCRRSNRDGQRGVMVGQHRAEIRANLVGTCIARGARGCLLPVCRDIGGLCVMFDVAIEVD